MTDPASAIARLVRSVEEVSGIAIHPQRFAEVEREAGRQAHVHCRGQLGAYAIMVEGDRAEAERLAEVLTIGETYFFRHWADFLVLRDVILPPLLERERRGGPPPRVWSAACSTGEEAYSLAMLIESLYPASRAEVLATDLSDARLIVAREAVYRERSMRSVGGPILDRFLEPAGPKLARVTKPARSRVRFLRHNLRAEALPIPVVPGQVDVILCRNVLIYFGRDGIDRALAQLELALTDGGCLIVSSAEATLRVTGALRWDPFESSAVYRKGAGPAFPMPTVRAERASQAADTEVKPAASRVVPPAAARGVQEQAGLEHNSAVVGGLLLSRARRERGRGGDEAVRRASRLAVAAVSRLPLDSAPARLAALTLLDLDEAAAALPYARRAASLDPDDPMAHFALARALGGAGHADAATIALRNVERTAGSLPGTQRLGDAQGMTASVLLAAIRAELDRGPVP